MKRTIILVCSILLVLSVAGISYATEKEAATEEVYSDVIEAAPQAETEEALEEYAPEGENQETIELAPENDDMEEDTEEESE